MRLAVQGWWHRVGRTGLAVRAGGTTLAVRGRRHGLAAGSAGWERGRMRPDGLHHVSLNVRDVPAALDFYTRVLGLTQRADRPDFSFGGAWLDAGGQQIHLIEADVPPSLGQHFALG